MTELSGCSDPPQSNGWAEVAYDNTAELDMKHSARKKPVKQRAEVRPTRFASQLVWELVWGRRAIVGVGSPFARPTSD